MADKKMNDFPAATDGAYIYAEAADGSQIKISKADLASVVAELLGCITYVGNIGSNSIANRINCYGYSQAGNDDALNGPFISFGMNVWQCQIKANFEGNVIRWRISNNGKTTNWRDL